MCINVIRSLDDLTDFKPLTRQEIEDYKPALNKISSCIVFGRDNVYYIKASKNNHITPTHKLYNKVEIRIKHYDDINDKCIIINEC